MKKHILFVIVVIGTLLSGCERYTFTFNEQPVLKPTELFSGYKIQDLAQNQLTSIKPLLYLPNLDSISLEGNTSLDCPDAQLLSEQVEGQIKLPAHC